MGFTQACIAPVLARGLTGDPFLTDDFERAAADLGGGNDIPALISRIAHLANEAGLRLFIDVVLDRVDAAGTAARTYPELFAQPHGRASAIDPRMPSSEFHSARARFDDPHACSTLGEQWTERLTAWQQAGADGFRLVGLDAVPARFVARLVQRVSDVCFLGWTPGVRRERARALAEAELDGVFASTAWWDGRAAWYLSEHDTLRPLAPIVAPVEAPFGARLSQHVQSDAERHALYRQRLRLAAATSDGLLVPMGFEWMASQTMDARFRSPFNMADESPLREEIVEANRRIDDWAKRKAGCRLRALSGPGSPVVRLELVEREQIVVANLDLSASRAGLAPGEVQLLAAEPKKPILEAPRNRKQSLRSATQAPRIVVENVSPIVDNGAIAAKSIVGQPVRAEADIYMDGHDVLAADLLWRAADDKAWQRAPMSIGPNDRWQATFTPDRIGHWRFTVEAWLDEFATLSRALLLKHEVDDDVATELAEMRRLLNDVTASKKCSRTLLSTIQACLDRDDLEAKVRILTSPDTGRLVRDARPRRFASQHVPLPLEVDRREAGFASWYELFPRSQTNDVRRHGTFNDVIDRLPRVRDMGFDVLYFPPIHPIGTTARKGRNNSLVPAADDVGSVYAIGSPEGGHDVVNSSLGTLGDFRRLVAAARAHELEIALDFAVQCSPDHPWLREHPDWFTRRPDGTIKHAENPPKKYEDIVNVDFYAEAAIPELWQALRDVVLFWIEQDVKIFRVDNPHTKPLPFWQWLIADIRGRHPDVLFLSEAFTRPKMMYRLAKIGFSQSYTYFTWRNTKQELTDYLTELTTTDVVSYFRPNFFVNTPDINPYYLQSSGRAGFVVRAVLAATLSGLWGVYSGFELCEAAALPGREEYLDSEKYEIRVRDFGAPGNIVSEITAFNRLRRSHPALQTHLGLRFYNSSNDQVLVYGKSLPAHEDMVFVIVNLDPHHAQETSFEIPLWEWKLPDSGSLQAEDMMSGRTFTVQGKRQWLRLDPASAAFAIWRLSPEGAA